MFYFHSLEACGISFLPKPFPNASLIMSQANLSHEARKGELDPSLVGAKESNRCAMQQEM
jgi:hypothetical protein